MSTFVSVGNATQPFHRLIDAVVSLRDNLPAPITIQHGYTPIYPVEGVTFVKRIDMDMFENQLMAAKLVITHAGAGTVIHSIRKGKVPVVMARLFDLGEHIDDHQLEFASALEGDGRIVSAHSKNDLLEAANRALLLQNSPEKLDSLESQLATHIGKLLDVLSGE